MLNQIAFIDEFGNNGFDFEKDGVSTHFIISAILIDRDRLTELESQIEPIRKKHFQTGEMKSSLIGNNDSRRLKILYDLNEIDYHIFSVVVDKREVIGDGFQYPPSFYKFLHSLVDRELFRTFPDILVVADDHGRKEFKEGFIKYIKKKHIPDLFQQAEFKFTDSKSELLIQVADIVSGTLARCYDDRKMSDRRTELLKALHSKITEIKIWPINYRPFAYDPDNEFSNYDPTIAMLGLNLASLFLKEQDYSTVLSDKDQCICLRHLLFHFRNISPEAYIPTHDLISHIESFRHSEISIHYFRSKIIAKLRDSGVIISSSNRGYKLPSSAKDLFEFVSHSNSYIQPMIDRLLKCRNQIKLATKNELDILDREEFKYLKIIKDHFA